MDKIISSAALISSLRDDPLINGANFKRVIQHINDAPAVDTVVHGRWVVNTDDFTPAYRCTACGYNKPMIAGERVSQGAMNYCPNCGAKMDGGNEDA